MHCEEVPPFPSQQCACRAVFPLCLIFMCIFLAQSYHRLANGESDIFWQTSIVNSVVEPGIQLGLQIAIF